MTPERILLVDIGNSRVKWGLGQAGRVTMGEAFSSGSDELRGELEHCWGALPVPAAAIIANVAGHEAEVTLRDWLLTKWRVVPRFVRAEARACGVANGYDDPGALGVDRWVCLLGAHRLHAGPLCVADCGTALTIDALDRAGRHMGGWIGPGLELMRRSLIRGTQGLRQVAAGQPDALARNTADAVQGGILQMAAGAIERFVGRVEREVACVPHLFLTGGDARVVGEALDVPYQLVPDLMLNGLLLIAEGDA